MYERFGRRIAVDGYVVAAFEAPDAADAAAWLAAQEHAPRVLVGSDRGAAAVLALAAGGAPVDGVIVAGAARGPARRRGGRRRGAHRLPRAPRRPRRGGGARASPPARPRSTSRMPRPSAASASRSSRSTAAPTPSPRSPRHAMPCAALAELELVETVDGLHDALNDASHRSVAATIVLWLERLRAAGVHDPDRAGDRAMTRRVRVPAGAARLHARHAAERRRAADLPDHGLRVRLAAGRRRHLRAAQGRATCTAARPTRPSSSSRSGSPRSRAGAPPSPSHPVRRPSRSRCSRSRRRESTSSRPASSTAAPSTSCRTRSPTGGSTSPSSTRTTSTRGARRCARRRAPCSPSR